MSVQRLFDRWATGALSGGYGSPPFRRSRGRRRRAATASRAPAASVAPSSRVSGSALPSTTLPAGAGYTTLEIKVNYVRALTAETGPVRCEARAIHVGGRTATAEGRVVDASGKLYAHGTTTCLIFRP